MKRTGLAGLSRGGFDPTLFEHQITYRDRVVAHGRVPTAPRLPTEPKPARKSSGSKKRSPAPLTARAVETTVALPADVGWTCPFCQRQNTERRPVAAGSMTCTHCGRFVSVDHID